MDLDFILVHRNAKKELGQYPAFLTGLTVTHISYNSMRCQKVAGFSAVKLNLMIILTGNPIPLTE